MYRLMLNADPDRDERKIINQDKYITMTSLVRDSDYKKIIAVHEETSRIAGILILRTYTKENRPESNKEDRHEEKPQSRVFSDLYGYMEYIEKQVDVFKLYTDCESYTEFELVTVRPTDRQKGLAFELLKAGKEVAKENPKVNLLYGIYTSPYSQNMAKKLGKRSIFEMNISQYTDKDGIKVFQGIDPKQVVSIMTMKI
ncbi:uncharacterized protein LOC107269439 isoform X2 [Cephus cinctus]|nr:uncharacterized protein LOC107269439 isoform X2 [Cephus cinctus]